MTADKQKTLMLRHEECERKEACEVDVCVCVRACGACAAGAAEAAGGERDGGWGRVCAFLQKLGKKADSRSLRLSHCDLTATDLLELGECALQSNDVVALLQQDAYLDFPFKTYMLD